MASFTKQPTGNQSPDATLGGDAVQSPTNTGHATTTVSPTTVDPVSASCRWHTFQSEPPGLIVSKTLKIGHSSQGTLSGAGATNAFTLSYTLNGGGSWINAVARVNFTALQSGTFSVGLSLAQDISQVQVRDIGQADVNDIDLEGASVDFSVSDIRIEIEVDDDDDGGMM